MTPMDTRQTTRTQPKLNPLLLWEADCPLLQDEIAPERWNEVADSPRAQRLAIVVAHAVEAGVDRRVICRIVLGWARVLERLLPCGAALDLLRELLQRGEATLTNPAAPLDWYERAEHELDKVSPREAWDDVGTALSIVLGEITAVSTRYELPPEASQGWDANLAMLYTIHRHAGAAAERVIDECASIANRELFPRAQR
jgi:hypothetical protein